MRLRELGLLIGLTSAFGCSKQPEAVFVNLNRIAALERPESFEVPGYRPAARVSIPPTSVTLPRSPGILILDQAAGQIDAARRLIEADREAAIRTLSRRLAAVRGSEIEAEKLKALEALRAEHEALIRSVYGRLFEIFEDYAIIRGPKVARKRLLEVRKPDLYISRGNPTNFAEQQKAELAKVSEDIRTDDVEYDRRARALLEEAELKLGTDLGQLQLRFENQKANAIERAQSDARRTVESAGRGFDLNLGENKSVMVSDVPGQTVQLPGARVGSSEIAELSRAPVVSDAERLKSLAQQLEIWLKTKGYILSQSSAGARNATAEFDEWRRTHQLGR